ncbi:MAG TPA: magnesium transporter [Vicinamibacterales bacterium]|jgi:magnesium transporter
MTTPPSTRVRIVLATRALVSFASASRAAALAIPDLGFAAFYVASIAIAGAGSAGPWLVLGAVGIGLLCRAIDVESWALLVPGGMPGRVERAFGARASLAASATVLVERLLAAALACEVFGHYAGTAAFAVSGVRRFVRQATIADVATAAALLLLGYLWIRARTGHLLGVRERVRNIWVSSAVLIGLVAGVWLTGIARTGWPGVVLPAFPIELRPSWSGVLPAAATIIGLLRALAWALPAIGGGEGLWRVAGELEPPRIRGLHRTAVIVGAFSVVVTAGSTFLFAGLIPEAARPAWMGAPLLALVAQLAAPRWLAALVTLALIVVAAFMLAQAARSALTAVETAVSRLSTRGVLSDMFRVAHPTFGTLARTVDTVAFAAAVVIVTSSGRVEWLARAYTASLAFSIVLHVAALIRLRARRGEPSIGAALPGRFAAAWWGPALWAVLALLALPELALLGYRDAPTMTATLMLLAVAVTLVMSRGEFAPAAPLAEFDAFQLRPSDELSLERVDPRPGCLLVSVRNPHALMHVAAALRTPRDRDIVVMTARLRDVDVEEDGLDDTTPTAAEQLLFARVLAIAERYARPVRLLVVPASDVFDAIVAALARLQASELYVGESATLSAEAQARFLGEAWERGPHRVAGDVRLVIHHASGRADIFHIGAHAPALSARDLELIHSIWLDAARSIGPHIHHHDVVRAALTQMAQQLNGPERDSALQAIRQVAKPADELATAVRTRDFTQLRDIVRNRPAADLAELLADLNLDDQAVVFRLLPRRDAAATFEYLAQDAREALLKTLSKEDVAGLLNNMAPDDRTMFLEELPATATRELLALLTPKERAIAVTLLGYPEHTVGRLMTPDYVAVHEDWTVQQVLDYVRTHGQDSETLNVIYVVDPQGGLTDDIRIREFLLTDPARKVSDLMDRRFVALKATDDQQTAVAAFRQHDRSALPVTDTAGVLIGIVTIDDVLDVAESEATKDIQRIGGSEALDEPYMEIGFLKMVQKRAGWLTALFLGEMLTATAMGFFEHEIEKAVLLALFVPLIISSGGNSGSQASTLVIRALALGELTLRDWWKVMRRELGAGLALGTILAIVGFLRITVWSAFSDIYGQHWLLLAFTVAFALVGVVMWGTLIGSLLPLLLRRLGFDPATSSAPFVATLVDVTGLVIYFSVALVVLRGTLL